jgi:hypothetical protein
MNKKFRIKEVETDGYYFPGYSGLIWHSGDFWIGEIKAKKISNNGSLSLLYFGSKKSVKQLRLIAKKCKVKIFEEPLPF